MAQTAAAAGTVNVAGVAYPLTVKGSLTIEARNAFREELDRIVGAYTGNRRAILRALTILILYKGQMQRKIPLRWIIEGFEDPKTGKRITEGAGCSEDTVRRALKDFTAAGIIHYFRTGASQAWTFQLLPGITRAFRCISYVLEAVVEFAKQAGVRISRARAHTIAKNAAKEARPGQAAQAEIESRGGRKMRPHKEDHYLTSPFSNEKGKQGDGQPGILEQVQQEEGENMLKNRRTERAKPLILKNPKERAQPAFLEGPGSAGAARYPDAYEDAGLPEDDEAEADGLALPEEESPRVVPSWQTRERHHRREVSWDEEHSPVLQTGVALATEAASGRDSYLFPADESAAPRRGKAFDPQRDHPDCSWQEGLTGLLSKFAERTRKRRMARMAKKTVTVPELEDLWLRRVRETTGQDHPAFTMKDRGMLKNILKNIPVNEPDASWPQVIDWMITEWGVSNAAARPFAFRHPENVERIIEDIPRIRHFLHHAGEYLDAYILVFFGEGAHPRDRIAGEAMQKRYAAFCARASRVREVGHDRLPPEMLSDSELTNRVTERSHRDARAQDALRQRNDFLKELGEMRQERGRRGRKLREELEHERRAHRVREGWQKNLESGEYEDMFPTVDMSGYFED